jgi:hypothetical protein
MPEYRSKLSAPQRRSVEVVGIYEAWHYVSASWACLPPWHKLEELDDRAYSEALDDARDRAEELAAERIGMVQSLIGKRLQAGHRMVTPWTDDRESF